ncbi:hypothetical protein FO519_008498 [Halicephalobus sp. NKZ332]|nr:hypothetical protein FO519_008498 [Halicephalobus sp. NKZ332]
MQDRDGPNPGDRLLEQADQEGIMSFQIHIWFYTLMMQERLGHHSRPSDMRSGRGLPCKLACQDQASRLPKRGVNARKCKFSFTIPLRRWAVPGDRCNTGSTRVKNIYKDQGFKTLFTGLDAGILSHLTRGARMFLREQKGAVSVGFDHQLYASNKHFV